jgi:hypothetical protein
MNSGVWPAPPPIRSTGTPSAVSGIIDYLVIYKRESIPPLKILKVKDISKKGDSAM